MLIRRRRMALLRSVVIITVVICFRISEINTVQSAKSVKDQNLSQGINKILQKFYAIKTIGKYLISSENGTTDNNYDIPLVSSSDAADVEKNSSEPDNLQLSVFAISEKAFGRNITEKVVKPLINLSRGNVSPDNRDCTTPDGSEGFCDDLKNCPQLNWDLFSDSICFRNTFSTGVCCPRKKSETQSDELSSDPKDFETQAADDSSPTTSNNYTTTIPENITSHIRVPTELLKNSKTSSDCGRPEIPTFRVIGGVEALPGRWPWMAAIFIRDSFICGGTLIGPKHILTAAHCTRNSTRISYRARQYTVVLGDIDLYRDDEPSFPEKYSVVDVRVHRQYSTLRTEFPILFNDIAILVLNRHVKRNKYVMPLCLPPKSSNLNTFVGERTTLVGWGSLNYDDHEESAVQRQVTIPVLNSTDCKRIYNPYYVEENHICAGWKIGGRDACHGDSGGPLIIKKDRKWMQIGIVSFGEDCGKPRLPGVYTKVTGYLDWIKKNMV